MRIERLDVRNFRCFEDRTFVLDDRFTLSIGANATGKTAVLDALAIALGAAETNGAIPVDTRSVACQNRRGDRVRGMLSESLSGRVGDALCISSHTEHCPNMSVPLRPKIYHIVHTDRLQSIVSDGCLWCDAKVVAYGKSGTMIGIQDIKNRRMRNELDSRPGLHVGECVPFYFCPRSVMLYVIHKGNNRNLVHRGGQNSIIHLEADLYRAVEWANGKGRKWAFTLSNAGSDYFEDRCRLDRLKEIDWEAAQATNWQHCSHDKQAEFLMEDSFPWRLVERIGVRSVNVRNVVSKIINNCSHLPKIKIKRRWYY